MRIARVVMIASSLFGSGLACQEPEGSSPGSTDRVSRAGTQADVKCDNDCFSVCSKTTKCNVECNIVEDDHCRTTTCGSGSGLPCDPDPGPGTGGSGGGGGSGGAGGGVGGACGPQLCQATGPRRLVGQKVDWASEVISEHPLRFRKFRAVFDLFARAQVANFPGCDISCCDVTSSKELRCEGSLPNGDWGAGAGDQQCHPPTGDDQASCTD
jgi:hypothetical protein